MTDRSTILLVDDYEDALVVYSLILEREGYTVVKASTGRDCLDIARKVRPDLILLDIRLPDINGIEVCKQIKTDAELSNTLVVLVSAVDTSVTSQVLGLETGADGYLAKPFEDTKMLAQIRALLRIGESFEASVADKRQRELERLANKSKPSVAAHLYGAQSLRKSFPDLFNQIVARYSELLDMALEQQAYKVDHNISEGLHEMVERLGFLKAGPRDVVDIHSAAIRAKTSEASFQKAGAYISEGRIRLLELMGYLISYYRDRSLSVSAASFASQDQARTEGS